MITPPRKIISIILSLLLVAGLVSLVVFSRGSVSRRKYPERDQVVFWHTWTGEWRAVVERIVDRFNQSQTQYEVVPLSVPAPDNTKFLLAVIGGDPPDCMVQWGPVIPLWASEGVLMPMDEMMSPEEMERIKRELYPAAWNIGSYDGHFYGMATCLNAFAIFYRTDHFREAGLDPDQFPVTLEAFTEAAAKLDKLDNDGNIVRLGYCDTYGGFLFSHWAALFGGGLYDWQNRQLTINTPRNVRAMEWYKLNSNKFGPERMVHFGSSLRDSQVGSMDWSFMTGQFSMVLDGQWRVEQLAKFAPNLQYNTAPAPPPREGGRLRGGWSNGNFNTIPRGAKCPKGALAFSRFWAGLDDPVQTADFMTWGGWIPPARQVVQAPVYQAYLKKYPQFRPFVEMMESPNNVVWPPVTYQNYLFDRANVLTDMVMRDTLSPQAALEQLAKDVEQQELKIKQRRSGK